MVKKGSHGLKKGIKMIKSFFFNVFFSMGF